MRIVEQQVEQVELDAQPTAVVRASVPEPEVAQLLGEIFGEVMTVLAAQGVQPAGMPFGCYVPTADGVQVEAGFPTTAPVAPEGRVVPSRLPGGPAVQVLHRGPYSTVPQAYEAAESWLAVNGWATTGPPWESYLDGPEVAEPRTLVTVPCRRRRQP